MAKLTHRNKYLLIHFFTIVAFCNLPTHGKAQLSSNQGQDFWLGYGAHSAMYNADGSVNSIDGGAQEMRLYLSAATAVSVTIEMPLIRWSQTLTLQGGTVNQQVVIPKTGGNDARLTTEGISNKGIHISSTGLISAYCHIYSKGSSAASLLLPEEILGQDYYILGAPQTASGANSFAYCFIVASEDGTTVEITPSAATLTHSANVPFTVQLNRGQVFNLIGSSSFTGGLYQGVDLTGTRVRTLSTGIGPCKKIAVFAGSSNTAISCSANGTADNIVQQVLPYRAWGKFYYTIPTANMANNRYRILTTGPTRVLVNNVVQKNLVNGSYYEFETNKPAVINATNPVLVAQYVTSAGECSNNNGGNGDPEMIYLPSISNYATNAIINLPTTAGISSQYLNVILQTVVIDSFFIDKATKRNFFKPLPSNNAFSYAQIPISSGSHTIHIDSLSFSAIAYGYGPAESYAFNALLYVATLSSLNIKNPYSNTSQSSPCEAVPFNIQYTLKKRAVELVYDFKQNKYLSPNTTVDIKNPVPDSVYRNKQDSFFRYTLPAKYTYSNNGTPSFNIYITEYIYTDEGCIEERTVTYPINVKSKPAAAIDIKYKTCGDTTLSFNDNSVYTDGSLTDWLWNFGDKTNLDSVQNPVKHYKAFGDYKVSLRSITDNGCFADTSINISLNPLPKVNFGNTGLLCPQSNLQFNDSSSISNGWQIAARNWNFGDATTSTQTNPAKQYNSGGSYSVKLVETSNKGCTDSTAKVLTIYTPQTFAEFVEVKNPFAVVKQLQTCRATPFNLSVTFTARQQGINWDFGNNANLSPNNNINIASPLPDSIYYSGQDSFFRYSLPAAYNYAATGNLPVKITALMLTKGGCTVQTVFNHTILVSEKPVAQWLLDYNSCANDTLNFKDASIATAQTINVWQWIFGDGATDNIANPVKKYAAYGKYDASLHIVTNIGCYADTVSPISLSPSPVAAFGYNAAIFCVGNDVNFTDSSTIIQPFKIAKWLWNFDDGGTASTQNISHDYQTAGTYNVKLIAYSDNDCTDTAFKTVTIYNYPVITMPGDVFIAAGNALQIPVSYTGTGLSYVWTPAISLSSDTTAAPVTNTLQDIIYTLTVTGDGGCPASANINVHVEKSIEVPNAFSPNGDGVNDTWRIGNIEGYPTAVVRVFNRNGQLVFSSTGYKQPWNGTFNNSPLPIGTYYYIIDTKSKIFPGKSGSVTIVR